eukprot:INCI11140.1.p1 GENE.INCI11140.1~~INCI11140.1.p1  ORF type:complete len:484 (+),score=84.20 INCI11140.1:77-1528(+)
MAAVATAVPVAQPYAGEGVAVAVDDDHVQSASLLASADAGGSGDGDVQEVNIIRKAKTRHLKTLVLGIVASFFFLLLLFYPAYPAQPATWAPVLFLLVYFVYLCESLICVCQPCLKCGFGSSTFAYVSNIMSDKAAEGFVAALMAAAPVFVMTVECYHYETRTRTVSNGNGGTRTETYQAKVVTWRATDHIVYSSWMDRSTQVTGLSNVKLMKMKLAKKFEYADEATYDEFERQRMVFRASNNFDLHQDYSESLEIEGFTSHVLAALNGIVPKNVSKNMYIIVTVFCGSYFYRRWLDKLCHATDVNIRKRVSATTYDSPLVFGYETRGNESMFLGLTYQNFYGRAHPTAEIAQAAQAAINVPVAVPMAQEYVPQGEGAANVSEAQIPKTEGAPPAQAQGVAAAGGGAPAPGAAVAVPVASAQAAAPAPAPVAHNPNVPRGVSVPCPQGATAGQRISFRTPEGNTLTAEIPAGISAGQTFIVHY